jgi:hypothetical protein
MYLYSCVELKYFTFRIHLTFVRLANIHTRILTMEVDDDDAFLYGDEEPVQEVVQDRNNAGSSGGGGESYGIWSINLLCIYLSYL